MMELEKEEAREVSPLFGSTSPSARKSKCSAEPVTKYTLCEHQHGAKVSAMDCLHFSQPSTVSLLPLIP